MFLPKEEMGDLRENIYRDLTLSLSSFSGGDSLRAFPAN